MRACTRQGYGIPFGSQLLLLFFVLLSSGQAVLRLCPGGKLGLGRQTNDILRYRKFQQPSKISQTIPFPQTSSETGLKGYFYL